MVEDRKKRVLRFLRPIEELYVINDQYINQLIKMYEIIDRIMAAILEAGFDPERDEIQQIKEKFGTLRVYVSCDARQDASDESQNFQTGDRFERILSAIKANDTSGKTCEECGKPGRLLVSAGWWSTRCPEHANADALPPAEYFAKKQTVRGRSDDGT